MKTGKVTATRYHDISCGHRVYGHESKCAHLHGHNYRFWFTIEADKLDSVGRVLDFSVIKTQLCEWLEIHWDHKFLIWNEDPIFGELIKIDPKGVELVAFNPTAENIAKHMVEVIAPALLNNLGARLIKCVVEETRKCSAAYEITGE